MNNEDIRYFDGKFGAIDAKIERQTELLHKRINDHAKEDQMMMEKHEETHHVIGWPKVLGVIIMIAGAICGVVALWKK